MYKSEGLFRIETALFNTNRSGSHSAPLKISEYISLYNPMQANNILTAIQEIWLPRNTVIWTTFVFGVKNDEPNRDYTEIASIFRERFGGCF